MSDGTNSAECGRVQRAKCCSGYGTNYAGRGEWASSQRATAQVAWIGCLQWWVGHTDMSFRATYQGRQGVDGFQHPMFIMRMERTLRVVEAARKDRHLTF
eukprot:scaffold293938_cov24-Tisochrysis_lutea.AAC.2